MTQKFRAFCISKWPRFCSKHPHGGIHAGDPTSVGMVSQPGMVSHAFNLHKERGRQIFLSSRLAWSTQWVPGQWRSIQWDLVLNEKKKKGRREGGGESPSLFPFFFFLCWVQSLAHGKQVLYHWAISQPNQPLLYFISIINPIFYIAVD